MGRIFTPAENDYGRTDAVVIGGGIVVNAAGPFAAEIGRMQRPRDREDGPQRQSAATHTLQRRAWE